MTSAPLTLRLAGTEAEITAAQRLRHRSFHGCDGVDADDWDAVSAHLLLWQGEELAGCCRLRLLQMSAPDLRCYTGQSYDLAPFFSQGGLALELGRLCLHPAHQGGEGLQRLLAGVAHQVLAHQVDWLFGCASFSGTDPVPFAAALAGLAQDHLLAHDRRPGVLAPEICALPAPAPATDRAMAQLPPLLRGYLGLGGQVGDHLVVDRAMGTLHIFTALEVAKIPPLRHRLLSAMAAAAA